MKRLKEFLQNKRNAQSASELAIFGAILLFVIGLIVRVGLQQGQSMNIQLRAMRMGLTESYKTAQGAYRYGAARRAPAGARNNASVMIIEDRLAVDSAQDLGTRDRIPMVASGGGTFSHNLFWSLDWANEDDLPVYDVIINGQRFPFSTGAFREILLPINGAGGGTVTINPLAPEPRTTFPLFLCSVIPPPRVCWENNCVSGAAGSGCVLFNTRQLNIVTFSGRISGATPAGEGWCDNVNETCPGANAAAQIAEANWRFNLDHDGAPDVNGNAIDTSPLRDVFHWQWRRVAGMDTGSLKGRRILVPGAEGISVGGNINRSVDVDGDDQEEFILEIATGGEQQGKGLRREFEVPSATRGRITSLKVMDYQEGDIDFNQERVGPLNQQVGLQRDVQMYSRAQGPQVSGGSLFGGTYFMIEEGKLLGVGGQFIRDVTRQDNVDLVTRFFQLTKNTGRFCTVTGPPFLPRVWNRAADPLPAFPVRGVAGLVNPVEACAITPGGPAACGTALSGCVTIPNNMERTCLDVTCDMLYIRSRIEDLRGHSWITRVFQ